MWDVAYCIVCVLFIVPTGEPRSLTLYEPYPTSLWLQWLPPAPQLQNGVIIGYQVSWELSREPSHKNTPLGMKNVTSPSVTIESLETSTSYKVVVAAFNTAGVGPPASTTARTTNSKWHEILVVFTVR